MTAVNKPVKTGKHKSASAHRARFQRYINRAAVQPPAAKVFGGLGKCDDLCVRGGVGEQLSLVVGLSDDLAFMDDHAPDRYIAVFLGDIRLVDSTQHEFFICLKRGVQIFFSIIDHTLIKF